MADLAQQNIQLADRARGITSRAVGNFASAFSTAFQSRQEGESRFQSILSGLIPVEERLKQQQLELQRLNAETAADQVLVNQAQANLRAQELSLRTKEQLRQIELEEMDLAEMVKWKQTANRDLSLLPDFQSDRFQKAAGQMIDALRAQNQIDADQPANIRAAAAATEGGKFDARREAGVPLTTAQSVQVFDQRTGKPILSMGPGGDKITAQAANQVVNMSRLGAELDQFISSVDPTNLAGWPAAIKRFLGNTAGAASGGKFSFAQDEKEAMSQFRLLSRDVIELLNPDVGQMSNRDVARIEALLGSPDSVGNLDPKDVRTRVLMLKGWVQRTEQFNRLLSGGVDPTEAAARINEGHTAGLLRAIVSKGWTESEARQWIEEGLVNEGNIRFLGPAQ